MEIRDQKNVAILSISAVVNSRSIFLPGLRGKTGDFTDDFKASL
jgi:hypothetical protein